MKTLTKSHYKKFLLGGAMALAMGATPLVAHATPYAFAGNQITNLLITNSGSAITGASGNETIYANAQYNSPTGISYQNSVQTIDTPLALPAQAYQGPSGSVGDGFSPQKAIIYLTHQLPYLVGKLPGFGERSHNIS